MKKVTLKEIYASIPVFLNKGKDPKESVLDNDFMTAMVNMTALHNQTTSPYLKNLMSAMTKAKEEGVLDQFVTRWLDESKDVMVQW